jgi:hypothetical protein
MIEVTWYVLWVETVEKIRKNVCLNREIQWIFSTCADWSYKCKLKSMNLYSKSYFDDDRLSLRFSFCTLWSKCKIFIKLLTSTKHPLCQIGYIHISLKFYLDYLLKSNEDIKANKHQSNQWKLSTKNYLKNMKNLYK